MRADLNLGNFREGKRMQIQDHQAKQFDEPWNLTKGGGLLSWQTNPIWKKMFCPLKH
jgi:hypothetical protein